MQITVIIVTHNSSETIALALDSLLQHPNIAQCMVIDNASTDTTVEIIKTQFPDIRILENSCNMGFGAAYNQGLMLAKTEFALLLHPHINLQHTDLDTLLGLFSRSTKLAMISAAIEEGSSAPLLPPVVQVKQLHSLIPILGTNTITFATWGPIALWRIGAMKQVGFFDPACFLHEGEDDLISRTHQAGYDALVIDGRYIKRPPITHQAKRYITDKDADPTLPIFEYWESLFTDLDRRYKAELTQMDKELENAMQRFKEKESSELAAHKFRIAAGLREHHKIPETNPTEQARWDAILQQHQDDWIKTVEQHEQAVNMTLQQHGEQYSASGLEHETRWKTLERRKDHYLQAFSRAGRSLTPSDHYRVFAFDPGAKRDTIDTVTIAIITYQRPESLQRALLALQRLVLPPDIMVTLLVVDNDEAQSAMQIVHEAMKTMPFLVEYVLEAKRGIPHARNKALEAAEDSDYIAFVDDDDTVDPQWLCAMMETAHQFHADVVKGEVIYTFSREHQHLSHLAIFMATAKETGQRLLNASTNNVLLSTHIYKNTGLRFDAAFTQTGGSDHHFFRIAQSQDARIVFCADGIVYSDVSGPRTTWQWIARRYMRYGAISSISGLKHNGYLHTIGKVIYSLAGSTLHLLRMTRWVLLGKQPLIHPVMIVCYMLGCIMGLFHLSPREYK